jgi:hypothetical protein
MASDVGIRSNDRGATVHSDVLTGHVARSVRGMVRRAEAVRPYTSGERSELYRQSVRAGGGRH